MNSLPQLHRRQFIAITLTALALPLCSMSREKVFKAGAATSNFTVAV